MGLLERPGSALPYLALTILASIGIYFIEKHLVLLANQVEMISVGSGHDESEESVSYIDNVKISKSKKVSDVLQHIEQKGIKTSDPWVMLQLKSFNAEERLEFYLRLGNHNYAQQNYQQVANYLNELSPDERIQNGVQLSYAYSLTRIAEIEKALEAYRVLTEQKPNAQSAHLNLGLLLKKHERCDEAITLFSTTVGITSGVKKSKAYLGLGSCLYEQKRYGQAVHALQKATEYRPDSAMSWAMLAQATARIESNYHEVLDLYNKVVALTPKSYKAYLYKGRYQLGSYDFAGAALTLKKAGKLSNSMQIQEQLIWAYLEQGKRNNARKYIQVVKKNSTSKKRKKRVDFLLMYLDRDYQKLIIELDRKQILSRSEKYLRGLTNRRLGYFRSAMKIFESLESTEDYGRRSLIQQARIKRSQKEYSQSIALYNQLLGYNNKAPFLWFESALVYEKLDDHVKGTQHIVEALKLNPNNTVYQIANARLQLLASNVDEAIQIVKAVLDRRPNSVRALNLLSEILLKNNKTDQLVAIYKKILEIDDGNYEVMYRLAELYSTQGEVDLAHDTLKVIITEKTDDVRARYLFAKSYFDKGSLQTSLSELEKLLRLDSKHNQSLKLKKIILTSLNGGM